MTPTNDKILVSVNMTQKSEMKVGEVSLKMAHNFNTNFREKSPVICKVEEGNEYVREGQVLIAHHNLFYEPSPHLLEGNLFAIPFNKTLFAILHLDGSLSPICGNVLCDRVEIETTLPLPPELRKQYIDRVTVTDGGWTMYKTGDLLFTKPHSYYQIVYTVDGVESQIHKCDSDMVIGVVKAKI